MLNEQSENKTRATWERGGGGGKNVSAQPPRVFRISFYAFLLNDFSPLPWSLERARIP